MFTTESSTLFLGRHANQAALPGDLRCLTDGIIETSVVEAVDGATTYEATWRNPDGSDLTLDGHKLYRLLDNLAPIPGIEERRDVIRNLQGVHELRDNNDRGKAVLEHHRRVFGEHWVTMAMSRRLLQTVLEGYIPTIDYDASIHIWPSEARPIDKIAADKRTVTLAALAEYQEYRREHRLYGEVSDDELTKMPPFLKLGHFLEKGFNDDPLRYPRHIDHFVYDRRRSRTSDENFEAAYGQAEMAMDPEEIQRGIHDFIDRSYEQFTDKNGVRFGIPKVWRSEEGISAQAHYHQRRYIAGFTSQLDTTELCMQYPLQDEPLEFGISGTHSIDRHSYFGDAGDQAVSLVRPVLRWRSGEATRDGKGGKELVKNDELPTDYTVEGDRHLIYADTLSALMVLALTRPDITSHWPQSGKFEGRKREIPLGAAQVPLLTLLSSDKLLNTTRVLDYLEQKTTKQPVVV